MSKEKVVEVIKELQNARKRQNKRPCGVLYLILISTLHNRGIDRDTANLYLRELLEEKIITLNNTINDYLITIKTSEK